MLMTWLSYRDVEGMVVKPTGENHSSSLRFDICKRDITGYCWGDLRTISSSVCGGKKNLIFYKSTSAVFGGLVGIFSQKMIFP